MRATLYADGFGSYPSVGEEIAAIEGGYWSPTSVDFSFTGGPHSLGIASLGQFLGWISTKRPRTIQSVALIGHGGPGKFAFAGRVIPRMPGVVEFSDTLFIVTLSAYMREVSALRDRFTADASITFYCCKTGSDGKFLKDIATAFGVTARGFSGPINWCVTFNPARTAVQGRGRTTLGACPGTLGIHHLTPDVSVAP